MPRTAELKLPLRDIRNEAGVSYEDMALILSQKVGRPVSVAYVRLLENRGTRDYDYISAYAMATGKHISLVAEAAKPPPKIVYHID